MAGRAIVRDGRTGEAVVGETEVRVSAVLDALAEVGSTAVVLERYPQLSADDVAAVLAYAARAVGTPAAYPSGGAAPARVREAAVAYGARANVDDDIFQLDARIAALSDDTDFLRLLRGGLDDVRTGNLVPHEQAMAELDAIFAR